MSIRYIRGDSLLCISPFLNFYLLFCSFLYIRFAFSMSPSAPQPQLCFRPHPPLTLASFEANFYLLKLSNHFGLIFNKSLNTPEMKPIPNPMWIEPIEIITPAKSLRVFLYVSRKDSRESINK